MSQEIKPPWYYPIMAILFAVILMLILSGCASRPCQPCPPKSTTEAIIDGITDLYVVKVGCEC